MPSQIRFFLAAIVSLASLCCPASADDRVAATGDEQGVLVWQGDRPVLFYQRAVKSIDGQFPRNGYVHPLYGLDGQTLTEDFPPDHRHQRGIYWAWHQVWVAEQRLGDPWICQDFLTDVRQLDWQSLDDGAMQLSAHLHWKSPAYVDQSDQMIAVVDERTTISVFPRQANYRIIDFDIVLQALVQHVQIGGSEDDKGYGGFSVRVKLNPDQRFETPAGQLAPTRKAIEAGPWVDLRDQRWGIVIMPHPLNPGDTNRWILRRSASMQNPVYPGRDPVPLAVDSPTRLRYRLVVHGGHLNKETINRLHAELTPP